MPLTIELSQQTESSRTRVRLRGVELVVVSRWHPRSSRYVLDIESPDGTQLRTGIVVVDGMVVTRLGAGVPQGALVAVRLEGTPGPARLGELGLAVVLLHYSSDELDALSVSTLEVEVHS